MWPRDLWGSPQSLSGGVCEVNNYCHNNSKTLLDAFIFILMWVYRGSFQRLQDVILKQRKHGRISISLSSWVNENYLLENWGWESFINHGGNNWAHIIESNWSESSIKKVICLGDSLEIPLHIHILGCFPWKVAKGRKYVASRFSMRVWLRRNPGGPSLLKNKRSHDQKSWFYFSSAYTPTSSTHTPILRIKQRNWSNMFSPGLPLSYVLCWSPSTIPKWGM